MGKGYMRKNDDKNLARMETSERKGFHFVCKEHEVAVAGKN